MVMTTTNLTITDSMTTIDSTTTTVSTTTTGSKSADLQIGILLPVSLVFVLSLLIIIACISFSIYKRRQSTSLSNLTKPHKESEENSYASSEHSREFSSKQSDSPDPGYDVIKMEHLKEVDLKSIQLDNNSKFELSTKETSFKNEFIDSNLLSSTLCSSEGDTHKPVCSDIYSGEYHNYLSDDNHSNNSSNETKEEIEGAELNDETNEPHTYSVVHYKVRDRQRKKERKVDANEAPQKQSYSSYDEAPSIPHHTVETIYTAVQKRPKDSIEIEDESDAPPIPPYTGEEYHTSGT